MMENEYDIAIIGGGINGVGIAADAAGRGLKVLLCEKNDFASGTSSNSSKLIHGGLRYLEMFEFRLVRASLKEREVLMRKAPQLTYPLQFIMPHAKHLRPKWQIRIGLWLYDHLSKRRQLAPSKQIKIAQHPSQAVLKNDYQYGFQYTDCWTDDSRLVLLNAIEAQQHGATLLTYHKAMNAERYPDHWQLTLENASSKQQTTVRARVLINASGPWVNDVNRDIIHHQSPANITLSKGSHIIVRKQYPGEQAFILQHEDGRVIFILPFGEHYNLIGTTDVEHTGNLEDASINAAEIDYLCQVCNHYLAKPITPDDVIGHFAGVRPLLCDGQANLAQVTRDYKLELDAEQAPLLTIFGGKLTTYRKLAEQSVDKLKPYLPHMKPAWTAFSILPGGNIENADRNKFIAQCQQQYPWLPQALCSDYASRYGTRITELLGQATQLPDLGQNLGHFLFEREIEFLQQYEWATNAEDILFRRTRLGLVTTPEFQEKIHSYWQRHYQ